MDYGDLSTVQRLKRSGKAKVYLGGDIRSGPLRPALDPLARARNMKAILGAGLDGGFFWDAANWWSHDWDVVRRYGDRNYLERILDGETPSPRFRNTISIQGMRNDRYNAWNAY